MKSLCDLNFTQLVRIKPGFLNSINVDKIFKMAKPV